MCVCMSLNTICIDGELLPPHYLSNVIYVPLLIWFRFVFFFFSIPGAVLAGQLVFVRICGRGHIFISLAAQPCH